MITPRSSLKFDLFAQASRQHKRDEVGDPLQVIARHIDFAELARLVDALIERSDGRKGCRPAYPTEVMVRILVLKRLYLPLGRADGIPVAGLRELPALLPAAGCMREPLTTRAGQRSEPSRADFSALNAQ